MSKPSDFDFYCEKALKPGAKIKKVFENKKVLAYYHTEPSWEMHIVVIPKEHIWDVRTVYNTSLFGEIMTVCRNIIRDIPQASLDEKGAQIITNVGKFQDTPHLHFHVVMGERIR